MTRECYNVLKFIRFNNLTSWNVKKFSHNNNIDTKFNLIPIRKCIKRNKDKIEINDEEKYKRVTIKTNNGGVVLRDVAYGKDINTKNQFKIKKGQLILSKIDARNGAIGIVNEELDNAVITGNFWVFDADLDNVNLEYLVLILTSKWFVEKWDVCSNGGGNRLYLQEELFLDTKIPLPELEVQNQIVKDYNRIIVDIKLNEKNICILKTSIEKYLFDELGILEKKEKEEKCTKYNILKFIRFKNLARWEKTNKNIKDIVFNNCKYEVVKLGDKTKFVTRSWKRNNKNKEDKFNYIEIGSINPESGEIISKDLKIKNAPSRATQIVKKNDLIIGLTRPYLKKFAIVAEKNNGDVCSSGFQVIEESKEYNLKYILEILKTSLCINQFEELMTGALYPAINQQQLKEILIPFPNIEIQNKISDTISNIQRKIKKLEMQNLLLNRKIEKFLDIEIFS